MALAASGALALSESFSEFGGVAELSLNFPALRPDDGPRLRNDRWRRRRWQLR